MLEWATDYFEKHKVPDPRLSIEWLLAKVLEIQRLDLYLKFDRPLSPSELERLRPLVKRRARHEPLQYIVGFTDFMNARIEVTPDVLIPRIETEQLVEIVLDEHSGDDPKTVLDIGTGSGCIPVALKMERAHWSVSALELSEEALEVARKNAEKNEVDINFMQGDILRWEEIEPDGQPFDLIISNPPYVLPGEKDELEPQVVEHEPHRALFCQNLEKMYGSILEFSDHYLADHGALYLEIHEKHAAEIATLFEDEKWELKIRKDYEKKPRYITAQKK